VSRGIGTAAVLAARTEDQLRAVAKQIEAARRRAIVVPGNLTDFDLRASLAETAWNEFGRFDIVNSMRGTMPRPLLDTPPRFLKEAFRLNVSAGHALIRAGMPRMLESDHPGGPSSASRRSCRMWPVAATWGTATATSVLDIVMSSDELRTAMEDATPLKRPGHVDDTSHRRSTSSSLSPISKPRRPWPGPLSLLCGPSTATPARLSAPEGVGQFGLRFAAESN
jgi:7-alpha-hydroxysteroid dehydrogenase